MKVNTHPLINSQFSGRLVELSPGASEVYLDTTSVMVADEQGLIHGGFIFSAADYAAMCAVNDPHVVLGSAEVKFMRPVRVGQGVSFHAKVKALAGKRTAVEVSGFIETDKPCFEGTFICFVLPKHVLDTSA